MRGGIQITPFTSRENRGLRALPSRVFFPVFLDLAVELLMLPNEYMLHRRCRTFSSELFSLDINLAIQLLSAFEGKIIYPEQASKKEIFIEATETVNEADEENVRNPKFPFKEIQFSSSLTHKNYYTRMNEGKKVGIYDEETNEEIPNYSSPSKKQMVKQAVLDLEKGHTPSNIEGLTLYQ